MKSTIVAILVVLLVGGLVAPAAAGTLIADVLNVTSGLKCGTLIQSGNVVQISFKYSGAGCLSSPTTPFTLALCRVVATSGAVFLETDLVDANQNGKIDVTEGTKFGLLAASETLSHWEVQDPSGACGGNVVFRTGFRK